MLKLSRFEHRCEGDNTRCNVSLGKGWDKDSEGKNNKNYGSAFLVKEKLYCISHYLCFAVFHLISVNLGGLPGSGHITGRQDQSSYG